VIVYGMNVSADGYVVDAEGSIDFTEPPEDVFSYWIGVQRALSARVGGRDPGGSSVAGSPSGQSKLRLPCAAHVVRPPPEFR